jgi:hypothetical protein
MWWVCLGPHPFGGTDAALRGARRSRTHPAVAARPLRHGRDCGSPRTHRPARSRHRGGCPPLRWSSCRRCLRASPCSSGTGAWCVCVCVFVSPRVALCLSKVCLWGQAGEPGAARRDRPAPRVLAGARTLPPALGGYRAHGHTTRPTSLEAPHARSMGRVQCRAPTLGVLYRENDRCVCVSACRCWANDGGGRAAGSGTGRAGVRAHGHGLASSACRPRAQPPRTGLSHSHTHTRTLSLWVSVFG